MARGVNKVILVGIGADPETRSMPSGMTVTNIRIATSESWKDKASGAQQERTEWHSIALFGRLGEIAAEYLRKGSQVFVEGKLRTRNGRISRATTGFTTEIIADNMQMLGARGGGGAAARAAVRIVAAQAPRPGRLRSVARAGRRQRGFRRRHPVLGDILKKVETSGPIPEKYRAFYFHPSVLDVKSMNREFVVKKPIPMTFTVVVSGSTRVSK